MDSVLEGMLNAESEKHQEPRNQVPEEGSGSEEDFAEKSCIQGVKDKRLIHLIIEENVAALTEYEGQDQAPCRELAPHVLIFQTSPWCNIFKKKGGQQLSDF